MKSGQTEIWSLLLILFVFSASIGFLHNGKKTKMRLHKEQGVVIHK